MIILEEVDFDEPLMRRHIIMEASRATETDIVITRIFDAPRELVFDAWTDPEKAIHWWGPKDFASTFADIDLHIGGKYLMNMRSPEGVDYWSTGIFLEVELYEWLLYTDSFSDEHGNVVPATYYGMSADIPEVLTLGVKFEDHDGGTLLTLRHIGFPDDESRNLAEQGWNETLDKLVDFLADEI